MDKQFIIAAFDSNKSFKRYARNHSNSIMISYEDIIKQLEKFNNSNEEFNDVIEAEIVSKIYKSIKQLVKKDKYTNILYYVNNKNRVDIVADEISNMINKIGLNDVIKVLTYLEDGEKEELKP